MVSKPPQSPVSASHAKKGKFRDLDLEFVKIGVPSLVQFTASPLAALVDAMYLGRLGPVALGGAGTAIAAQYSVAKLANDPLLRTSISLVATGSGEAAEGDDEASAQSALDLAVSTALLLAITVGAVQALFYSLASKGVIRGMGIGVENPMFGPAVSYLRVRALGAPAETLWLVTNGVFRGLGDTLTPLKWAAVLTVLNAVLDPLFIFSHVSFSFGGFLPVTLPGLQMGCAGAAAGTAVAQYVALGGILWELRRRASPCLDSTALLRSVKQYLSAVGTQSKPANHPASQPVSLRAFSSSLTPLPFLLLLRAPSGCAGFGEDLWQSGLLHPLRKGGSTPRARGSGCSQLNVQSRSRHHAGLRVCRRRDTDAPGERNGGAQCCSFVGRGERCAACGCTASQARAQLAHHPPRLRPRGLSCDHAQPRHPSLAELGCGGADKQRADPCSVPLYHAHRAIHASGQGPGLSSERHHHGRTRLGILHRRHVGGKCSLRWDRPRS